MTSLKQAAYTLGLSVLTTLVAAGQADHTCDEFFQLVQQWGPTFCSYEKCSKAPPTDRFTLHGLWPSYYADCHGRPYPTGPGCAPQCNCPYKPASHSDVLGAMQKFWPSYKGPNAEFWKHEWDKHGTCLITYEETLGGSVTTQHDYFAKALELRQDCDLVEALSAEGISPGDTAPAQEIADAISRQCGRKQPQLVCCSQCKENNYLESVYNCYDDEFNLVDCKAVVYKNICEGDVTLPIDNSLATA